MDDLVDDDGQISHQEAHEQDKGEYTDLRRDFHGLCLEALEFQLLHIVAEHLKVVDPIVASPFCIYSGYNQDNSDSH